MCLAVPSPPLLFIAFFTSHRSPLSERLEQATKITKESVMFFNRGGATKLVIEKTEAWYPLGTRDFPVPKSKPISTPTVLLNNDGTNFLFLSFSVLVVVDLARWCMFCVRYQPITPKSSFPEGWQDRVNNTPWANLFKAGYQDQSR